MMEPPVGPAELRPCGWYRCQARGGDEGSDHCVQRWAHINSQLRRPDCVTHDDDKLKQTQQGNEQTAEYFLQTSHSGNIHKRNVTHQHVNKPYRTHAATNLHWLLNTLNSILMLILHKQEDWPFLYVVIIVNSFSRDQRMLYIKEGTENQLKIIIQGMKW